MLQNAMEILLALSLKHLVTTDVRLFELGAEIVW